MKGIKDRIKISAVMAALGALLGNTVFCSGMSHISHSMPYDMPYSYINISNCTIESKSLKISDYSRIGKRFRFIIDLSPRQSGLSTTQCVIVEEETDKTKGIEVYRKNRVCKIYRCFYEEIEKDGVIVKKAIPPQEQPKEGKKRILIPLNTIKKKEVHDRRIEEAVKIKNSPLERKWVEESMLFLYRATNLGICQSYFNLRKEPYTIKAQNSLFIKNFNRGILSRKCMHSCWHDRLFGYNLAYRLVTNQSNINIVFLNISAYIDGPEVSEILEKVTVPEKYQAKSISIAQIEKEFEESKEKIIKQIKNMEEKYVIYSKNISSEWHVTKNSLIKEANEEAIMYINILTNGAINPKMHGKVFSGYEFYIKDVEEQTDVWNRKLVDLLINSLIECSRFRGGREKAIKMLRKRNEKIMHEINSPKRKEHLFLCFYANRFRKAFKDLEELSNYEIGAQFKDDQTIYNYQNKPKEVINGENIRILNIWADVLVDINLFPTLEEKKQISNSIKNKATPLLNSIPKYYLWHENPTELAIVIKEKKKMIEELLLSLLVDAQLVNTACKELATLKEAVKTRIKKNVEIMFTKHTEWIDYAESGTLLKVIQEERMYISTTNALQILTFLIDFADNFWYSFSGLDTESLVKTMKLVAAADNPTEWFLDEDNLLDIFEILERTYSAYMCIDNMSSYDEIWTNPAVLYLRNYAAYTPEESISSAYIIYRSEKDRKVYKREIEFTDATLNAFGRARTSDEIEAIEKKKNVSKYNNKLLRDIFAP